MVILKFILFLSNLSDFLIVKNTFQTRKCSCMNARGIPTVVYQGGGVPLSDLARGYHIPAGGYPTLSTPLSDLTGGYPIPAEGVPHLRYPPHQIWLGVSHSCRGYPILGTPSNLARGTPPQVPPIRPGRGYPIPVGGTPSWVSDLARGTPPWVPPVRPGCGVSHLGYPHHT